MNWDAISAISEVAGVLFVIASVWYLAIQIRKQTDEARMTATRELARDFNEYNADLSRDPEFVKLYRKALADIDSLEDDDRFRVGAFISRLFRCFEQHYLHLSGRTVDAPYMASINFRMREMLALPGIQLWWERNRSAYESHFRDYVESLLIEAKSTGYESSFKKETK
jgi:hypothetical protein